jgi:AcrR family transcriptional regulator
MPRVGLNPDAVTDAALDLLDEQGPDALTLAELAKRVGVATPSLYKHVRNLAELRDRLALRVLDGMTARLAEAVLGRSGDEALGAAMRAYRGYVLDHPRRYAAVSQQPSANPEVRAAGDRLLGVITAVLRGYGLSEPDLVHATRCARTAAHGFASLQAAGAFQRPEDLDATYAHLIRGLIQTVHTFPTN